MQQVEQNQRNPLVTNAREMRKLKRTYFRLEAGFKGDLHGYTMSVNINSQANSYSSL